MCWILAGWREWKYNIAKMKEELIEKVIKDGHKIADKIRSAATVEEVDALESEIERYSDFADENFGIVDDFDDKKDCELSTFLYVAVDWKNKTLYPENVDNSDTQKLFEGYLDDFENFLDSREWVDSSYGVSLDSKNAE